jgi:GNAT superfamily N-acetyltransferase
MSDSAPGPTADVSVRVAWADDADAIAMVQARTWPVVYADLLPPEALEIDPARAADIWREVLARPADARGRVLVALERNRVMGYAITSPASDPDCDPVTDAELMELTIDPRERGKGHGSRLLQAAVDTMQADRFSRAVLWAVASDEDLRRFLADAGWAPDTAHRELDLEGDGTTLVKQVRLHTSFS